MRDTMRAVGWSLIAGGLFVAGIAFALYSAGVMALEIDWLQQHATARFRGTPLTLWLIATGALNGPPLGLFVLEVSRDRLHKV